MSTPTAPVVAPRLVSAIVVRVEEEKCYVTSDGSIIVVDYAPQFPSPRLERVSPGHRVALIATPDGRTVVLWRWYDAVVVGLEGEKVRLWEPAHGELVASARHADHEFVPGTRAYLSAGLPGADWWVAGPVNETEPAFVELAEVELLYTKHDLWGLALS